MKKRYLIPIIIVLLMAAVNLIARLSRSFSDFYVQKIFPVIGNCISFVTGLFPFSVGEILILIAIALIIIGIPVLVILLIFMKQKRRNIASFAASFSLWVIAYIVTAETLNCFVMYQCTPFSERYFSGTEQHTEAELEQLYELLINEANELSAKVPRDGDDRFILTCDYDSEVKKAMKKAAADYPQLKGYYPSAKPIQFSYFMSQSHLLGIYFPFTIESNYNDDMVRTNLPSTICHEYAHLKGIIQEDEANFISFIACTGSDNIELQYSGILEALEYVHNEVYDTEAEGAYYLTDTISAQVTNDWFRFLPDNYWEENAEKEIISTETVSSASDTALDTNIRMNGRDEGIKSYSRVVELLLDYYSD